MLRRTFAVLCSLALAATLLSVPQHRTVDAAPKTEKKKSLKVSELEYDPEAEEVGLFEGMASGQLSSKMVPKSALNGTVFVTNLTDQPLTVKLPEAMIGVQKQLAQFGGMGGMGGMGGGMGGMGMGGMGGGMGGMGGGGMQMMGMGGGMGGMGGGMGMGGMGGGMGGMGGMGGGGGFFSVPPESTAAIPLKSLCLEHGKPDPLPSATYVLVPYERVSSNPVLKELLVLVGTGKVDQQAAQAAAWHLTDGLSFAQLASKTGPGRRPYFTPAQLTGAVGLLGAAQANAARNRDGAPAVRPQEPVSPRVSASIR